MLLHLVPYIQTALLISQAEQNQHISCLVGLTCQETEASAVFGLSRESHLTDIRRVYLKDNSRFGLR